MPHPALLVVSTEQTFPSTDPPAVVTQIANPRVGPMALRQRKRRPVYNFTDNTSTISAISNALAFILEMTQDLAATETTPLDEAQSLATTTSGPVDGTQGITAIGADPLEDPQGIVATDALTLEDPQGVATTGVEQLDERQNIVQTGATGVDEVQPVSQLSQFAVGANVSSAVGQFTAPASTIDVSVSGLGFTPKLVLFWANLHTSSIVSSTSGTSTTMPMTILGYGIDSSHMGCIGDSDDFSSGDPFLDASHCLRINAGNSGSPTDKIVGTFVSQDSTGGGGFTVHFNTTTSGAVINYMAIGGADFNVGVATATINATGHAPLTGSAIAPTAAIIIGGGAVPLAFGVGHAGLGFVSSLTDRVAMSSSFGNSTVNQYQRTNKAYVETYNNAVSVEADIFSFDSGGLTLDVTTFVGSTFASTNVVAICMSGANFHAGAFDMLTTATTTLPVTGVGFTPQALLVASWEHAASTSVYNPTGTEAGVNWMVGGVTGASARGVITKSSGSFGVDSLDTSKVVKTVDTGSPATVTSAADWSSWDTDGFTLNQSTHDSTARQIIYLALGGSPSGMPYESLLGTGSTAVSQTAQLFIEALQAIAATGVFPLDELQAILQTSGDVIEDPQGVAQTDAQIIEDPQGIKNTDVAALDEAGGVAQTGASGVDEVQPISSTGSEVVEASQGVTQSGTEVIEDPQGITATGTEVLDEAQGIAATTSDPVDETQGIVQTGVNPVEETQGVATVALVPYTALQGIAQTSGDPYESLGNTPVSQVAAMVLEALQGILQTDVMTLDETQSIVGTGSEVLDEAGGVASTTVAPLDEPGGIAATGIMPLSKLQGIVQLALTVLDATQNLATTVSDPLESAQGVNTTVSGPIESTQGVTATGSDPYESLGNTAVSQTSSFIIEALGAVTATGQLVLEALQSLASTGQLALDETQGVVITGSPSPVEAPGGVSVTDVQIVDATGAILSPRDLPLDVTGAILTIGLAPVETTAGVAPTTVSVPLEAAQGILKALTHQLEEPGALVVLVPLPIDSISAIPVRILVFVGNADALRYAGTVTLAEQLLKPGAVTPGEALLHPGNVAPVETPLHPGQVTESDATAHPGNAAATDDVH